MFADFVPAMLSFVAIDAPADAIDFRAERVPELRTQDGLTIWSVDPAPVWKYETWMAAADQYLPMLWVGERGTAWEKIAREYLESISDRLAVGPDVEKAAREVAPDAAGDEIVHALAGDIHAKYVYQGLEFGRHARVMRPVSETLANRFGDCKDLSLLLRQMLVSRGIIAHLAVVNSGGGVRAELPSLDQFDHMVVYLPDFHGGWMLDPTASHSSSRYPVTMGLSSEKAGLALDSTIRG